MVFLLVAAMIDGYTRSDGAQFGSVTDPNNGYYSTVSFVPQEETYTALVNSYNNGSFAVDNEYAYQTYDFGLVIDRSNDNLPDWDVIGEAELSMDPLWTPADLSVGSLDGYSNAVDIADNEAVVSVDDVSNEFDIDTIAPTIQSIVVDNTNLSSGEVATVTVTFSEPVAGLLPENFSSEIGTLSNLSTTDDQVYTLNLTPNQDIEVSGEVVSFVPSVSVTDIFSNEIDQETSIDSNSVTVDTLAPEVRIDDGYEVVYHEQGVLVNADIYDLVASVTVDHDSTPVTFEIPLSMAGMGGMGGDEPEGSPGSPGMEEGHDHTVITGDDIEHATQDFLFNLTQDVFYDQDDVDAAAAASDPSVVFGADNGDGGTYTESDVTTAASVAGVVIGEVKTPATYTDEEVAGFAEQISNLDVIDFTAKLFEDDSAISATITGTADGVNLVVSGANADLTEVVNLRETAMPAQQYSLEDLEQIAQFQVGDELLNEDRWCAF